MRCSWLVTIFLQSGILFSECLHMFLLSSNFRRDFWFLLRYPAWLPILCILRLDFCSNFLGLSWPLRILPKNSSWPSSWLFFLFSSYSLQPSSPNLTLLISGLRSSWRLWLNFPARISTAPSQLALYPSHWSCSDRVGVFILVPLFQLMKVLLEFEILFTTHVHTLIQFFYIVAQLLESLPSSITELLIGICSRDGLSWEAWQDRPIANRQVLEQLGTMERVVPLDSYSWRVQYAKGISFYEHEANFLTSVGALRSQQSMTLQFW